MKEKKDLIKYYFLITSIVVIALFIGVVYAEVNNPDNSEGYKSTPALTQTIDAHSVCKDVTNTGGNTYFIPTKASAEWQAFRDNAPADVSLGDCCASSQGDSCGASACVNAGTIDCAGSCIGTLNKGAGTDCGTCRECNGAGSCSQVPADDSACGTIDCDGRNYYYQTGTQSSTATETCYYRNYVDITSNRCEGLGNCKDANTADCTSYANAPQYSCGTCRYISGSNCVGSTRGGCSNYGSGTSCGSGMECNGSGSCVAVGGVWVITDQNISGTGNCYSYCAPGSCPSCFAAGMACAPLGSQCGYWTSSAISTCFWTMTCQ